MPRSRSASAIRLVLVVTACLAALILVAGGMFWWNVERSKSAAFDVADRVMSALQIRPKVVVNQRTIIEQQTEVLQLVTMEKQVTERKKIEESWLHSTKTLEVEADFVIRAGFDLAKPFVIEVDESQSNLRVTLPPAEILSVDIKDVRFPRGEDGWWNKLSDADREQALRELKLSVALQARGSDLRQQARASAEKRLTQLLEGRGQKVTFTPKN